jgi:hypothetical protein
VDKKLETLYELCEIVDAKLEESLENLKGANGVMTVSDIDIVDKLTHTLKCIKTSIAMIEAEDEEGGESRRSMRSYDGGSRRSYDGGYSNRRGRSPRTGRYVSRDGGYSGHDGIEDILEDVRDMPESERRKLKQMLERM